MKCPDCGGPLSLSVDEVMGTDGGLDDGHSVLVSIVVDAEARCERCDDVLVMEGRGTAQVTLKINWRKDDRANT